MNKQLEADLKKAQEQLPGLEHDVSKLMEGCFVWVDSKRIDCEAVKACVTLHVSVN